MIQITAYLRDEADLAKWKALVNKTEWLHIHLNIQGDAKVWFGDKTIVPVLPTPNYKQTMKKMAEVGGLCEHYQSKGSCMMKKCKYGKNKGG